MPGVPWRRLTPDEVRSFGLESSPPWVAEYYGPQPPAGSPWGAWREHPDRPELLGGDGRGGPVAGAVRRDINYADYKDEDDEVGTPSETDPQTYEYVIEAGRQGITEGSMYFGPDAGADFFREGADNWREFFRNWSLVTGVAVPIDVHERVSVSCAC